MFNLVSNFLDLFDLPENVEWYDLDGHKLFELRGMDGIGIQKLAYLIQRPNESNNKWYKYGIVFSLTDQIDRQACINKINAAVNEFQKKLKENPPSNLDPDSGSLGLDGF